ncbi:MAG: histone deacetylase [Methanoregula sp.]|jgi:acetoin utilization deacetylase AcuC-like enzyme|nr:histone deacetylase [Methanoregula sp.]
MARGCAIVDLSCVLHDNPLHPESQSRLLNAIGGIPEGVPRISPDLADPVDIHRIHDPHYTERLRERCSDTDTVAYLDGDTYVTRHSFAVAHRAVGGAIAALDHALNGEHTFAFVRPPGHHAERARAMGFCLFNNVAIAAHKALDSVDRVAIVDWDIHHGNGIQNAFYLSNRVLYCSVHQAPLFPYTGRIEETGNGTGKGFTINAPLSTGSSIADYHAVFSEVFVPAIERFRPDILLIAAGQDILSDDPLGGMKLQPEDFTILTTLLTRTTDTGIALVLEGGYSPSHGMAISSIYSALEKEAEIPDGMIPRPDTQKTVDLLKKIHRLV